MVHREVSVLITVVFLLVGLSGLGLAGYLIAINDLSKWGQDVYVMQIVEESPSESVAENASVIAYEKLPAEGQRAFDAARRGQRHQLWEEDDSQLISTLQDHDYIQYRGEYFEYGFILGHQGWRTIGAMIFLSVVIGSTFTVGGVSRSRRNLSV